MIRNPIAAGVLLALTGAAQAQQAANGVTVFGVMDLDFTYGRGSLTSLRSLGNSGLQGSRLGFRGVEDLGDGLRASFMLEHGFAPDTGNPTPVFWNRQSYVALGNPRMGEVTLGRQYTPTFWVHALYDAFGPQGAAAQQVLLGSAEFLQPTNVRANNAVNYTTPANLGGFALQAMVAAGEGAPQGKYTGVRGTYAAGPVSVDLALGRFYDTTIDDLKSITIGGRYKIGDLTLYALHDRANSGNSIDTQGSQVSMAYVVGQAELKASLAQSERKNNAGVVTGTTRRYGVGGVYNLSRRTAFYTSVARLANSDGAATAVNGATTAANQGATGVDIGIRHAF